MKKVTIATHDGIFHADEVFALAVLKLFFEQEGKEVEITRTRDLEKIALCDMAVDVGGEYSKAKNKFDHHQKQKPASRKNGIPYASFGLIWKHFGKKITSSKKVWEAIERKLVTPIDALDNGVNLSTPIFKGINEYTNAHIISAISSAYQEDQARQAFIKALEFAGLIVTGEIKKAEDKIEGEKIITEVIVKQGKPEVLVLEKYVTWEVSVSRCQNIKLVIFPDNDSSRWCIQAARDNLEVFGRDRISFPKGWRGLSNGDLITASGISDSIFCHTGGFFAVAKSKSAAIEMAERVIAYQSESGSLLNKKD